MQEPVSGLKCLGRKAVRVPPQPSRQPARRSECGIAENCVHDHPANGSTADHSEGSRPSGIGCARTASRTRGRRREFIDAIGLTPALAALIRPEDPNDPDRGPSSCLICVNSPATPPSATIRSATTPGALSRGLVHRYPDRVLIKLVAVCAVYCRFCFRRERSGSRLGGALGSAEFAAAVDYVRAHQGIWEVILTGGDPLTLSPRRIAEVTEALAAIGHVKVLRWHTRLPLAAPERVTKAVARALMAEGKTTVVAIHANHTRVN